MSFVIAAPEYVAAAATDLANIGSAIGSANSAALGPTSSVFAAGADEVSAAISALFNGHAQAYQALSAQAAQFHQQFVQLMNGGASEYALTEAANASPLQTVQQGLLGAISSPTQALVGPPAIGNGANGTAGTAASGTGRGLLFGNGGPAAAAQNGGNGGAGGFFGGTGVAGGRALTGTGAAGSQGGASGLFAGGGVGGIGASVSPPAGLAATVAQADGSALAGPAVPAAAPAQSVETAAATRPAAPEAPAAGVQQTSAAAPMARAASSAAPAAESADPRAPGGDTGEDGAKGLP
jgi:hypothetical protein